MHICACVHIHKYIRRSGLGCVNTCTSNESPGTNPQKSVHYKFSKVSSLQILKSQLAINSQKSALFCIDCMQSLYNSLATHCNTLQHTATHQLSAVLTVNTPLYNSLCFEDMQTHAPRRLCKRALVS